MHAWRIQCACVFVSTCLDADSNWTLAQAPASSDAAAEAADKAYSSQKWAEAEQQYAGSGEAAARERPVLVSAGCIGASEQALSTLSLEALQKAKTLGAGRGFRRFSQIMRLRPPMRGWEIRRTRSKR